MKLSVDLELARKYLRPGPRYTSYPTAPHFHESFGPDEYAASLDEANRDGNRPLSLYFHLPFCEKLCWFCGCTMLVTRDASRNADYLDVLEREIDLVGARLDPDRPVVQQHFGGGTPTYLSPDEIRRFGAKLSHTFRYAQDAEIGCEMDPRGLTREHVRAIREIGGNRASLGVQDHDPRVQQAIHRIQPREMVEEVIGWIREEGFPSLNLDLIYGLPFQSERSFRATLDAILGVRPDRLAVFNYAHVPWMKPHQKLIREEDLPDGAERLRMLKSIIETLTGAGYVYIGMDHFALETDELAVAQREKTLRRNFQGYSTRSGADIQAFGMSAISQLESAYAQNHKDLAVYRGAVEEGNLPVHRGYVLTEDDRVRREVIQTLLCHLELDSTRLSEATGVDFPSYFAGELERLARFEADGLIRRKPGRIVVTEPGRLFIRNIAMTFDAHLGEAEERYSKTV